MVDLIQHILVQMTHLIPQAGLVNGTELLQKDDRILHDFTFSGIQLHMGRQLRFVHPGRNGCADHCGAVTVSHVILDNQHGTDPALL